MFKMRNALHLLFCLLLLSSPVFGQKKELKTKFGKISPEEIAMTSYKDDPAAPAVVLFDKGKVSHRYVNNSGFMLEFERHVRVKIFNKEAYLMADVAFFHFKSQKLTDLKAVCYNMENGKLVETELEKGNVFDEKITRNRMLLKFNIPAVREGSIIEYRYTLSDDKSVGIGVSEWTFQRVQVPTMWSEFEAEVPTFISFKKMSQGWTPFALAEEEREDKQISVSFMTKGDHVIGTTTVNNGRVRYSQNRMHFIQENVPAMKPEPFVPAPSDYLSQIAFDIEAVYNTSLTQQGDSWRIANGDYQEYSNNWAVLGKEMLEDVYDEVLKSSKHTKDAAETCVAGKLSVAEKVAAIYEHIGKNYQVKKGDYLWMTQSLEALTKDRKGSPTDLNLLFINMLHQADIKAWPVLISTRVHGRVHPFRVSPDEMDRVIVAVDMDGKAPLLLDVSAFPNPIGLLDAEDLNNEGLSLKSEEEVTWVPLLNSINTRTAVIADLALLPEGGLAGAVAYSESGYGAVAHRKNLKETDAPTLVSHLFKEWAAEGKFADLKVGDTNDWQEPNLKINFNLESAAYCTASGNKLYLAPTLGLGLRENPFKNPERKFNIDLGVPHEENYILSFKIPAGYKVEELPKSAKIVFGDNALIFDYLMDSTPEQIKVVARIKTKKTYIIADEYEGLREFFTTMLAKMEEQVVLSKS